MPQGNPEDYTRLSWLLSRPIGQYIAIGIILLLYGLAFSTFFLPSSVFPFAPPLIIGGITVAWVGLLMLSGLDSDAVTDRLSKTGWQKETSTYVHNVEEITGCLCDEPECDEDLPEGTEIAERYSYDVLYIAGTEFVRKKNTKRRVCPTHADEDALGVELHDPRQETDDNSFNISKYERDMKRDMKRLFFR